MAKFACPICGDPSAYPIWIDKEPPEGCPEDMAWMSGGSLTVRNVAECGWQRRKAEQAARWRRICPEAFDTNGNMIKGGITLVVEKLAASGDTTPLVIGPNQTGTASPWMLRKAAP